MIAPTSRNLNALVDEFLKVRRQFIFSLGRKPLGMYMMVFQNSLLILIYAWVAYCKIPMIIGVLQLHNKIN